MTTLTEGELDERRWDGGGRLLLCVGNIQACVSCGYATAKLSALVSGDRPMPGDVVLCRRCGEIHTFDQAMAIRHPTASQWREISASTALSRRIGNLRLALAIEGSGVLG